MSWRLVAALLVVLVSWLGLYGLLCLGAPFRPCGCDGTCRRCKGTGLRLRRGRKVINHLRDTHDRADRATR